MGASLLVFSNKTDVGGCMSDDEIRAVFPALLLIRAADADPFIGASPGFDQDAPMDRHWVQCNHRKESRDGSGVGGSRCPRPAVPLLRPVYPGANSARPIDAKPP